MGYCEAKFSIVTPLKYYTANNKHPERQFRLCSPQANANPIKSLVLASNRAILSKLVQGPHSLFWNTATLPLKAEAGFLTQPICIQDSI